MLTVQDLLMQARTHQGWPSNYRLAKELGVLEKTVSNWQNGRRLPDDEMSVRLAQLAGIPPGRVLAAIHAQREPEGSPVRSAWLSLCIMLLPPTGNPRGRRRPALA